MDCSSAGKDAGAVTECNAGHYSTLTQNSCTEAEWIYSTDTGGASCPSEVQRPQTDGIANWQGQTKAQQAQPLPLPAALGRKPGMEQHAPPAPSLGQLGESASAKLRKPVMLSFATQVTE